MSKITKENIDTIRDDINEALKPVADKYGLSIHAGRATYTATSASFKLELVDVKANWESGILFTGLQPDDLGKECLFGKQRLTIVGFDNDARTNKILLEDQAGKKFSAPVNATIDALNRANPDRAAAATPTSDPDAANRAAERAKQDFKVKALMCGLKGKVELGQTFVYGADTYKVTDLNTKAPKYPIIAENLKTGKAYRFDRSVIEKEGVAAV